METIAIGTRVRVNEQYAESFGFGVAPELLEEIGQEGTVVELGAEYISVELDMGPTFYGKTHLYFRKELDPA